MSWIVNGLISGMVSGSVGTVGDCQKPIVDTDKPKQTAEKVTQAVKPNGPGVTIETKIRLPDSTPNPFLPPDPYGNKYA